MRKLLFIAFLFLIGKVNAFTVRGHILLNEKWESKVFLSRIENINGFTMISSDMIIAEATIDSVGYFEIDFPNAPGEDKFYRIHFILKDAKPASIIVGGKNENFFTLILNNKSSVYISADADNFVETFEIQGSKDCLEIQKIQTLRKPYYAACHVVEEKMEKAAASELFSVDSLSKIGRKLYTVYCVPVIRSLQPALKKYIQKGPSALANIYAAVCMGFPDNLKEQEEFYTELDATLQAKSATSVYVQQFHKAIEDSEPVYFDMEFITSLLAILAAIGAIYYLWYILKRREAEKNISFLKQVPISADHLERLNKNELEVFALVHLGHNDKEIAASLGKKRFVVWELISGVYKQSAVRPQKL
jgi:hypothetical protein